MRRARLALGLAAVLAAALPAAAFAEEAESPAALVTTACTMGGFGSDAQCACAVVMLEGEVGEEGLAIFARGESEDSDPEVAELIPEAVAGANILCGTSLPVE